MSYNKLSSTYIRDKKNRIRKDMDAIERYIYKLGESRMKREQKYGKHRELIINGEKDRIVGNKPMDFQEESMQLSYSYGYYEKASKLLEGSFSKGEFNEEEQKCFGINDVLNEIPEQYINNLKQFPSYLEGRLYQLGKNAYDFTLENGMNFEEYINIMSIICPEVNTFALKEGYDARKMEVSVKKQK